MTVANTDTLNTYFIVNTRKTNKSIASASANIGIFKSKNKYVQIKLRTSWTKKNTSAYFLFFDEGLKNIIKKAANINTYKTVHANIK